MPSPGSNPLGIDLQYDMSLDTKRAAKAEPEKAMLPYAGTGSRSSPIEID